MGRESALAIERAPLPVDFLPTASAEALRFRAKCMAAVRRFFDERGYFEVDTPVLSQDIVIDAYLEPLVVREAHAGRDYYLQTSPEFGMKRLLCGGIGAIYQLSHVFRQGERGTHHNPEFSMVEWYRTQDDHFAQMQVIEDLLHATAQLTAAPHSFPRPFLRTTYREAFLRHLKLDPFAASLDELQRTTREQGIEPPPSLVRDDRDGWLNLLLAMSVESKLGVDRPEFLYDYPASQSALAQTRQTPHHVAERFELYCGGIELCNGYHELLDPGELRRRNETQQAIRRRDGNRELPLESRLLSAMEHGLPPCAGVALGFDRLVMLLRGSSRIDDVIPFPVERA